MVTAIVGTALALVVLAFVVLYVRDDGPSPTDVAVAYEHAWDALDFETLWTLSGPELRDGLGRQAFVVAKRTAYSGRADLGHLARSVLVEGVDEVDLRATVRTRVELGDGSTARNSLELARRAGRWVVTDYELRTAPSPD